MTLISLGKPERLIEPLKKIARMPDQEASRAAKEALRSITPYPEFCMDPVNCAGEGHCRRERACND